MVTFQFLGHFGYNEILILLTFQFWWHFSFGKISVLKHFSFGKLSVLKTIQFYQHFSFGDISVLMTFLFWWYNSFGDNNFFLLLLLFLHPALLLLPLVVHKLHSHCHTHYFIGYLYSKSLWQAGVCNNHLWHPDPKFLSISFSETYFLLYIPCHVPSPPHLPSGVTHASNVHNCVTL